MSRLQGYRILLGAVASLLCAAYGITLAAQSSEFRARAQHASGVVVRNAFKARTASVAGRSYHPVVRFADAAGRVHVVTCSACAVGGTPAYAAGERVTVLYDPRNPDHVRIDTVFDRYGLPVLLCLGAVFGLVFLVLGPLRAARLGA